MSLRTVSSAAQPSSARGPVDGAVPAAVRARRPGWRDPRLWVGLAIMAASVLLGARLVGGADESAPVWALRADLGAGDAVEADDLVARRVRFTSGQDADRYLSADQPLPDDASLARDVGAGELLPRSALASTQDPTLTGVTFTFPGAGAPTDLRRGDRVDVYLTSVKAARAVGDGSAVAALRSVLVLDAGSSAQSLSGGGALVVTVGVPPGTDLTGVVQAAKTDNVFLVQVG